MGTALDRGQNERGNDWLLWSTGAFSAHTARGMAKWVEILGQIVKGDALKKLRNLFGSFQSALPKKFHWSLIHEPPRKSSVPHIQKKRARPQHSMNVSSLIISANAFLSLLSWDIFYLNLCVRNRTVAFSNVAAMDNCVSQGRRRSWKYLCPAGMD